MQVIILAAGEGRRFLEAGIKTPKPLVKVRGKSLLNHAYESLGIPGEYIFVCQKVHEKDFKISNEIMSFSSDCKIHFVETLTAGPAESAISCKSKLKHEEPLIIINCDQRMSWDPLKFLDFVKKNDLDGCVPTIETSGKNYSFVLSNEEGWAIRIAEKDPISKDGLIGLHYYKKAKFFIEAAEEMIRENKRQVGEFYISGTYNTMIEKGLRVKKYPLNQVEFQIVLGTPEEVLQYEK